MKTRIRWLCAIAAVLSGAAGAPGFGDEVDSDRSGVVFRPPLIQQVAAEQTVPTSRWDTQEPVQTPEQEPGAVAPLTGAAGPYAPECVGCTYPGLQWVVGVEEMFLWPQLSRTFLQTQFTNGLGTVNFINNAGLGTVDGAFLSAPRFTLGVQGECWGLVGRYFNATAWANTFIPAFPDSTQSGVILFDTFRAQTVDLEVQRRFCWRHWDSFWFAGVRYAQATNDRNMWIQNSFGPALVENQSFAGQQYSGAGLTFGVFGLRPLFCDDGSLKAYVSNRYSVVWGNGTANVQTEATVVDTVSGITATSTDGALAIGDGGMFIAEVGAGLWWDTCLRCFPARAFFRAGVEWQYWDSNAGVSVFSQSFALDQITGTSSAATANTADLMFDLVGFTIGAGITY